MTLVAAVEILNVPLVFGDILISAPGERPAVAIPTRPDAGQFVAPTGYSIAGVRRKVVLLHDRLAVAWARNEMGARRLVKELRGFVGAGGVQRGGLFDWLRRYPSQGRGVQCELVGWIVDDEGGAAFHWGSDGTFSVDQGPQLAGTGKEDFQAEILARPHGFYMKPDLSPADRALHLALSLAGNSIGREIASGAPLQHLYGGGIEVALFLDGRFRMASDVTFLTWLLEIDPDHQRSRIVPARAVLKFQHIGEHLVVHTARRDEQGRPAPQEIHIVSPVDSDVEMTELPGFGPLTSPIFCNFLVVPVPGAGELNVTLVLTEPNEYIWFERSPDGTESLALDHRFRILLSERLTPEVQKLRDEAGGSQSY
jgi:hypothetical protein